MKVWYRQNMKYKENDRIQFDIHLNPKSSSELINEYGETTFIDL